MADRPISIPPVDRLERTELLALVKIVSAGRIHDLDVATARWNAAVERSRQKSEDVVVALRAYTDARTRFDTAKAEGRSTNAAGRAQDVACAAYIRASGAAADADLRAERRWADLQRIRAGEESR